MFRFLFFLTAIVFLAGNSFSQISQGGKPMEFNELKSSEKRIYKMPAVDNEKLLSVAINNKLANNKLKPFQFAKSFTVDFSPLNSGDWQINEDGIQIWQITISSEGAKSINLIFDKFRLPEGSRLYLFNKINNSRLGAFTSFNNKKSGKFAVMPVEGDEVTVQYELPANAKRNLDFRIEEVNHDYYGILKYNDRRPLDETAGECNVDVNCEIGADWKDVKDAVCRMIVNGKEICTGTLINNTAEDQTPYIISAAHCYDKWEYAETTLYTFNYESPFCAPLDGDPSNTISGAIMKAQFDSLDFALVEMSLVPPPEFRPYFAGWNKIETLPAHSVSIHHPLGDIKKISFDDDAPVYSDFNSDYIENGFFEILRWDDGVTEAGSSGGPLFNPSQQLIATLTGGIATCSNPVRDYFSRISFSWDFKSENTKQLKHWLDPLNTGDESVDGKRFYENENLCTSFTNLVDNDVAEKIKITDNDQFSGYWGGTNTLGISEFVERFSITGNAELQGVSIGVGKIYDAQGGADSEIKVKVYNGSRLPESLIHEQTIMIKDLAEDAMNFIDFGTAVTPEETFFVGFELSNIQSADSFIVYQSLRESVEENFFYFERNGKWYNFQEVNPNYLSMTSVMEVLACNINENVIDTPIVSIPTEVIIYPNPTASTFILESGDDIPLESISVYNLLGKEVSAEWQNFTGRKVQIDLTGNVPGIYFVRVKNNNKVVSRKISFVPW